MNAGYFKFARQRKYVCSAVLTPTATLRGNAILGLGLTVMFAAS